MNALSPLLCAAAIGSLLGGTQAYAADQPESAGEKYTRASCWVVTHPDGAQVVLDFNWLRLRGSDNFRSGMADAVSGTATHSVCGSGTLTGFYLDLIRPLVVLYADYDGCAVPGEQYVGRNIDAYVTHYWELETVDAQGVATAVTVADCGR